MAAPPPFWYYPQAQWWPTPNWWMQGPIPLNGLYTPTPPPQYVHTPPPGEGVYLPPAVAGEKTAAEPKEKKEEKEDEEEKDGKPKNAAAPPGLQEGENYMFDQEHTMLHIFNKAAPVWAEKYRTEKL